MLNFKEWVNQLTEEDKAFIFKQYNSYDYDKAYEEYLQDD